MATHQASQHSLLPTVLRCRWGRGDWQGAGSGCSPGTCRSGQLGDTDPHPAEGTSAASSLPVMGFYRSVKWLPFFFEQVEGKSLSSTFTEGLLHFILQKKERRAPEHNRDGPGVISVLTGSPAANQYTKCDKLRIVSVGSGSVTLKKAFPFLPHSAITVTWE